MGLKNIRTSLSPIAMKCNWQESWSKTPTTNITKLLLRLILVMPRLTLIHGLSLMHKQLSHFSLRLPTETQTSRALVVKIQLMHSQNMLTSAKLDRLLLVWNTSKEDLSTHQTLFVLRKQELFEVILNTKRK